MKTKLDKKTKARLKRIDEILCCGYFGKEFIKYSDSWLEVQITPDDAKVLQEFHETVNNED